MIEVFNLVDVHPGSSRRGLGGAEKRDSRESRSNENMARLSCGVGFLPVSIFSTQSVRPPSLEDLLVVAWSSLTEVLDLVSGLAFVISFSGKILLGFAMSICVRIEEEVVPVFSVFLFFLECFCALAIDFLLARRGDLSMLGFAKRHSEG